MSEPAGKAPAVFEVRHITTGGRRHRRGRQQAHAGHALQQLARRALAHHGGQLFLDGINAGFELAHLFEHRLHRVSEQRRDRALIVGNHLAHLCQPDLGSFGGPHPSLSARTAYRVDRRRAPAHPHRAGAVQRLQGLLLNRLDSHRLDVGAAGRLQQRRGIGRIGFVALDVGPHVVRWQQLHVNAPLLEPTRPMVRHAARFHDHQGNVTVVEPAFKLRAAQTVAAHSPPVRVSLAHLKHRFGNVNANDHAAAGLSLLNTGCSIHFGLLRVERRPSHHMKAGWHIDAAKMRGSPSHHSTGTRPPILGIAMRAPVNLALGSSFTHSHLGRTNK